MSDNFNIQQGSNISNKQGGADSGKKTVNNRCNISCYCWAYFILYFWNQITTLQLKVPLPKKF